MNYLFSCGVCLLLLLFNQDLPAANAQKNESEYSDAYSCCKTEQERRDLIISAIDDGVIKVGCSVKVLDHILHTNRSRNLPLPEKVQEDRDVEFFEHSQPGPKTKHGKKQQNPYIGWYISYAYNREGQITNYGISNLHK